jgi:hypothetical protein
LFSNGREAKQIVGEQHGYYLLNLKEEATELVFEHYENAFGSKRSKAKGCRAGSSNL